MITEAFIVGLKEGLKLGIVYLVFFSFLHVKDKKYLIRPFLGGAALVFLFSAASFFISIEISLKDWASKLVGFVFAIFFIASVAALYQSSGIRLFGPFSGLSEHKKFLWLTVFLVTVLFFLPDSIGSSLFIKDMALMKEAKAATYFSALTGFLIAAAAAWLLSKKIAFGRIGRFFGIAQIFLFLSVVKMIGGGIKGFAELSLIPSLQRSISKFFHDIVHQVLVLLMIPDHAILSKTTFRFIGIFFGANIAMATTLLILLLPPMMFLYHTVVLPVPESGGIRTGAEKRKLKFNIRTDRRKKAMPVIFFIVVILLVWFSQRGEEMSRLYNPKPLPIVEDKGLVIIPLNDPTMDLMDGRLHKFSLTSGEDNIKILIIKRNDNMLTACLDACEICPPEGYGQSSEHVVCIYCNTPIPIKTLGRPGGCNPIPLIASVTDKDVRIEVSEILKQWQNVKTGKGKETVK